jgi:hypothetical protein
MERFDHFFVNITQETGGLEGLFHSMFSFLLRRTDFYVESEPGDKMGFPPGVNEQMLLKVFNSYRNEYYKMNPQKSKQELQKKYDQYLKTQAKQEQTPKRTTAPVNEVPIESKPVESVKEETSNTKMEEKTQKQETNPKPVQNDEFNDIR